MPDGERMRRPPTRQNDFLSSSKPAILFFRNNTDKSSKSEIQMWLWAPSQLTAETTKEVPGSRNVQLVVFPLYVKETDWGPEKGVPHQLTHQMQLVLFQISSIRIIKINLRVVRIVRGIFNATQNIYPIKVGINIRAVPPHVSISKVRFCCTYLAVSDFTSAMVQQPVLKNLKAFSCLFCCVCLHRSMPPSILGGKDHEGNLDILPSQHRFQFTQDFIIFVENIYPVCFAMLLAEH